MSDDWWDQLFKEFPSARKLKENPLANVDLLENVFGAVHVSGGEGWTAQQGEDSLDKQGDNNDGDAEDTDVDQVPPTQDISAPAESRTAGPSSSRTKANRKRSRAAQVGQAVVDCLSDKNKMIGNHLEFSCNQLTAMEALHSLSAIRHWSPLYKAAIDHLKQDPTNRQTFLFYKDDEDKVLYLEYATDYVMLVFLFVFCMNSSSILRLLIEDDELDLLFDENQYMCALLEEMGGATEADADRQLVRTNRGEGWRRVQRFMNGSEVQCYEILRMNQETFKSLCKVLSEK
ncbi:unnamed protein product, partial [Brassica napus]